MGTRGPALRRPGSGPRSCQQRARAVEHHGWPRGAAGLSAPRTPHPAPDPPPRVPALHAALSSLLQPNRPRGTEFRPTSGRARDPPLLGNSGGVSGTTGHPDPGHADPNGSLGGPRPPSPVWHLPVLPTQVPARLAGVRVCACACVRVLAYVPSDWIAMTDNPSIVWSLFLAVAALQIPSLRRQKLAVSMSVIRRGRSVSFPNMMWQSRRYSADKLHQRANILRSFLFFFFLISFLFLWLLFPFFLAMQVIPQPHDITF